MVDSQIVARGIRHPGVIQAMREVPRHLFVPHNLRHRAYQDTPLPIGHLATISQPYIVAEMTELLDPKVTDRVLEIGTGSGYQAAILARLVQHVYSIELVPELAATARQRLLTLQCSNVTVLTGNGYLGWPQNAPFHKIILTAAPPEMPPALVQQLARSGRLVAPVGANEQDLIVLDKRADGTITQFQAGAVMFVPMRP